MDAKVGIIGAGPAGVAAAVQLQRFNIKSMVFEKDTVGGLIRNAHRVDNTMLFPEGISGREFALRLEEYAARYSIEIRNMEIKKVSPGDEIILEGKEKFMFKYVIVATGTRARKLRFPGFQYSVISLRGPCNRALIVGGGDIALDYALTAAKKCREVIVLHRSELKALPALQLEVKENKKIRLIRGEIVNVEDNIAHTTAGSFQADVFLGAIGRVPNIEILGGIIHPRIYLAGDVKNGIYRQSSLAIADGIRAAMDIWRRERYGAPAGNR